MFGTELLSWPYFFAVRVDVCSLRAQDPNATLSGRVLDPSGAVAPGTRVTVMNDATNIEYSTVTNDAGIYSIPSVPPGKYHIQVSKNGFKNMVKPDVTLHVQDALTINFTLEIGAASESVTVEGGAPLVNTESAAVSTVIDRQFVENVPLNGRSFQDLILLTPGVVTNSPQRSSNLGGGGEFSVNGQRTESNVYLVDGVSGNVGVFSSLLSAGMSGSLPGATALGTTQALVSVEALEEFRVQTSSYSAEYGRNPGGQFSFATRSGTNQLHGAVYDYLRNNVLDANDWFNGFFSKPQAALRQNDFGGTLGGPIKIPRLYDGRDKTFFFFSYEGLRLVQPQAATITLVPTTGPAGLRATSPAALQPVLNAFPISNCTASTPNCISDLGNGLGDFVGTWSNPGSIDSYAVRLDHVISQEMKLFFRFQDTPSRSASRLTRNPSILESTPYSYRTYTLGLNSMLSRHANSDARINYSSNDTSFSSAAPDSFGGATPTNLFQLQGLTSASPTASVQVMLSFAGVASVPQVVQRSQTGKQHQWNFNDAVTLSFGRHLLKFGADYRRIYPDIVSQNPVLLFIYLNQASVKNNAPLIAAAILNAAAHPIYQNFSAFLQDEWRASARLSVSMGLRWEVNPAPSAPSGNLPYTVQGSSLSTLTLAPQGTSLWNTTWHNFAPRLGLAYVLRRSTGFETVVRSGGGIFFDTGQQLGAQGFSGPGFASAAILPGAPFPLTPSQIPSAIPNPPVAPYTTQVSAFPEHLQLPYTLQWNASIQQALGTNQSLSLSYLGSQGRRLLQGKRINVAKFNPNFTTVVFYQNGATSDYHALQAEFQRRLSKNLQALASYSWSHSIDEGSQNLDFPFMRGNSEFDVRHNFSAAVSYDLPWNFRSGFVQAVLGRWALDDRFMARTGFPVSLNGNQITDPITAQTSFTGLNLLPGQPVYIYGPQYPGGRSVNPAAFALPAAGQFGNAPRNFVRGFGAVQMDLALRREIRIHEALRLQFRAEAFNLFNHPNFGTINATFCPGGPGCTFGQATATLAQGLGVLSPLYQMGGPRSMQLALKLVF